MLKTKTFSTSSWSCL